MRPVKVVDVAAIAAAIWLVGLLEIYSNAGVDFFATLFLAAGALALGLFSIVRLIARSRPRGGTSSWKDRWWRRPVVVPVCVVAGLLLATLPTRNPLFLLRFRLSQSAFDAAVAAAPTTDRKAFDQARRIGLFRVARMTINDRDTRFITTGCGLIDACGVVFTTANQPTRFQEDTFQPISGGWWLLFEGF